MGERNYLVHPWIETVLEDAVEWGLLRVSRRLGGGLVIGFGFNSVLGFGFGARMGSGAEAKLGAEKGIWLKVRVLEGAREKSP